MNAAHETPPLANDSKGIKTLEQARERSNLLRVYPGLDI